MIIIITIIELNVRDLDTLNILNLFSVKNEIATYNYSCHNSMFYLAKPYLQYNNIKVLKIGAGNGKSTKNFIYLLNTYNYNYTYIVNEICSEYKQELVKILPDLQIKIGSFTQLEPSYYDLIFLTAYSAINNKKYKCFL